jgi:hypothetical protein
VSLADRIHSIAVKFDISRIFAAPPSPPSEPVSANTALLTAINDDVQRSLDRRS